MTRNASGSGTEHPASADKQPPRRDAEQPERLIVRITRYQPFIDIVSDRRKIVNAALLITLVTCLIFMALLAIVLTVKRIYPYNDIQTNALGAMTIKDEDKEVTYWLFNTAELWANSGIAVKRGDVLTIRASGLSHSAIHHLQETPRTTAVCATRGATPKGSTPRRSATRCGPGGASFPSRSRMRCSCRSSRAASPTAARSTCAI